MNEFSEMIQFAFAVGIGLGLMSFLFRRMGQAWRDGELDGRSLMGLSGAALLPRVKLVLAPVKT
ncbi:MAG: hypothetical protein NWS64_02345, partial [Microbacteriaceae bacterium]|nr:hypothetical protein [Microbacteriaceae bacterium]